jgi:hypothetical protein
MMVNADIEEARRELHLKNGGFSIKKTQYE